MFDLFAPSRDELDQLNRQQATNHAALLLVLLEKGVVTSDEYEKLHAKATHLIDQHFQQMKDEAIREFEERFPAMSKFFGRPAEAP